ncbi:MAG: hypothetical protein RI930_54 [Pseudomonadota bacterium]|jgi:hypothetical protein
MNIKNFLLDVLIKLNTFYLFLNQELLFAWRRVLAKQSDNRITLTFKILIENQYTALALNTILFYILSSVLAGQNGLIGMILSDLALLNIIVFCANLLGWIDKLKK